MHMLLRRVAAAVVTVALVALVACDLWITSVAHWWDRHSVTGSVVSSLLVLAVTALVVDEVVARRQRRERAASVAVQGLIVYGQARRACNIIVARDPATSVGSASEELRALATMLLTAAPNLFDDPAARRFLEQVERFSVSMIRAASKASGAAISEEDRTRLDAELGLVQVTVEPLLERIPAQDRSLLEGA
jgi:hypothetical protein